MKTTLALVKVVPDIRRLKNDNTIPLKLRVTFKGDRKYYATGHSASETEWEIINSAAAKGELRTIKNEIATIEKNAQKIIEGLTEFSFKKFEDAFFTKPIKYQSLETAFDMYIKILRSNGQEGSAACYQTAINSLLKFKEKLRFDDITSDFLKNYEAWMLSKEKSITTVGIYLRSLRTILNIAKDDKIISNDNYPFGKRKYTIPTGRNIKKALDIKEINKLFTYKAEPGSNCEMAIDFWIFSYLCNGMNIKDIAMLTWSSLDKTTIAFEREKTKRTKRDNPTKIIALRNTYTDAIINKWGTKKDDVNDFIFPIIIKQDSISVARKKIQQFTKVINKWLKRVGNELKFDLKLTTYVARHSFATVLIRNGAPMEFTGESLGHTSILTTQNYFAGFATDAKIGYLKALTEFSS